MMRNASWGNEVRAWRKTMIEGAINAALLFCVLAPAVLWLLSHIVCLIC